MALISQECGEIANIHESSPQSHSHFSISQPWMKESGRGLLQSDRLYIVMIYSSESYTAQRPRISQFCKEHGCSTCSVTRKLATNVPWRRNFQGVIERGGRERCQRGGQTGQRFMEPLSVSSGDDGGDGGRRTKTVRSFLAHILAYFSYSFFPSSLSSTCLAQ